MQADTIKLLFTYVIALVIILGGGLFLFATRGEPESRDLQLVIAGFMGTALGWVFQREAATQATRSAQSSFAAGAVASNPPT